MPNDQNEALFNLIGTTYGGDGQTTFALPNLQSRVPAHVGPGFALGQTDGAETVTLTTSQIPAHSHVPSATARPSSQQSTASPTNAVLADETLGSTPNPVVYTYTAFAAGANQRTLASNAIGSSGGSQPHDNMLPFVVINFIISLFVIFPSQA
jgi:microcystin-dependent protein